MEPSLTIVDGFTAEGLDAAETVFLIGVEMVFFFSTFFFGAVEGAAEAPISLAIRDISSGIIVSTKESMSAEPDRDFSTEDFSSILLVVCSSSLGFLFGAVFLLVDLLSEEDLVSRLLLD